MVMNSRINTETHAQLRKRGRVRAESKFVSFDALNSDQTKERTRIPARSSKFALLTGLSVCIPVINFKFARVDICNTR